MAEPLAAPQAHALTLSWSKASAIGMRESNEDALGLAQQDDMACFVMSDGAGGHQGGEVAARTVLEAVLDKFLGESAFGTRALLSYVEHAVAVVAEVRKTEARLRDMSATVATVLLDLSNRRAVWAHLGDTRIYLFRQGRLRCVTHDHSVAQQLVDAGFAQADQLRGHPHRSLLFAAVGAEGGTPVAVSEEVHQLEDGDAFLLCTDGFWEWLLEPDMERTLSSTGSSDDWLAAMSAIADANAQASDKARDNHSVYAIRLHARAGA
ncbi:PP2C family protein-serine/threonine phosphatase [Massilia glaciei]|nr:PP2C family serine/threonine-protein phosphatase [Massilia glaciei]